MRDDIDLTRDGSGARRSPIHRPTPRMRLAAVALAFASGMALTAGCDDNGDAPKATPSATASMVQLTGLPPAQPSAEDGGQLRLVEQGFSQTAGPDGGGISHVSFGLIVDNTSKTQGAYAPEITVELLDSSGKAVAATGPGGKTSPQFSSYPILPGQRAGLGEVLRVQDATVATLNITIGKSSWAVPNNTYWPLEPVTASDVNVEQTDAKGTINVSLTVHNGYDKDVARPDIQLVLSPFRGGV